MAFDPDKYLQKAPAKKGFDPDAYLSGGQAVDKSIPTAGFTAMPSGYEPLRTPGAIESAIANVLSGGSRKSLSDIGMARTTRPETNILENIIGAGETGLTLGTGALSVLGGYAGLAQPSLGKGAEERFVKGMERVTYSPRTEAGQQMVETAGRLLSPLQAIAPMNQISALSRAAPVRGQPIIPRTKEVTQAANLAKDVASKIKQTSTSGAKTLLEPFRAVKAGLYDPVVNQQDLITSTLTKTIGEENVPQVIEGLQRQARTGGVQFSAAQATGNPALASIEDTIRAISPGGELNLQSAKNRTVLANKIRGIAQDDIALESAKTIRQNATKPLYDALDDVVVQGGDELESLLARTRASGALQEAEKIANVRGKKFNIPVVEEVPTRPMKQTDLPSVFETGMELPERVALGKEPISLSGYLRKTGGISKDYLLDVTGEKTAPKSGAAVGLFTNKARSMDDAVVRAVEGGYLPEIVLNEVDGGAAALSELLATEIQQKQKVYPLNFDAYAQEMTAQYNATPQEVTRMIGAPATQAAPSVPQTVVGSAIRGSDLTNLKKGIDQAIKKAEPNSPLQVELLNLKNDYMNWLDNQGKGFLEANNKFAELSKPINQMKVGKMLSEKLIPATAEETPASLNAAQLAKALQNKDSIAKKITGISGVKLDKILTKNQLQTILDINSDASRIAEVQKLGSGIGSATARRLQAIDFIGENFKQKAPVTSKIIEILNNIPVVNYATKGASQAGSFLSNKLNQGMTAELERLLATDPQGLANALKKEIGLINNKSIKVDFNNPITGIKLESGLLGSTPAAAMSSGILNQEEQ